MCRGIPDGTMQILLPNQEEQRLAALYSYRILDTPPEEGFERIVALAIQTLGVSIAAVSFIDRERQWMKATRGLDVCEVTRATSLCTHTVASGRMLVVPDMSCDPRFADHPWVLGEANIRFYAGAPLQTPEGFVLGTLCVVDQRSRELSEREREILQSLAAMVIDELTLRNEITARRQAEEALRSRHHELQETNANIERRVHEKTQELTLVNRTLQAEIQRREQTDQEKQRSEQRFRQMFDQASDAALVHDTTGRLIDVNDSACRSLGYSRAEMLAMSIADFEMTHVPGEGQRFWRELPAGEMDCFEGCHRRKDGSSFPVEIHVSALETAGGRQLLALVRDITERKRSEQRLHERVRHQEAVVRLGARALSGVKVSDLLQEAVTIVGNTLGAEYSRIHEHLPVDKAFVIRAALGYAPGAVSETIRHDDTSFAFGYVLRTGQPLVIDDLDTETRFEVAKFSRTSGAKSGICVLIGGQGTGVARFGILGVSTRERRRFTKDDVYFVQAIANVVAAAVERQRGEEAVRALEARHQRIAANTPGMVFQFLTKADGSFAFLFVSEGSRSIYGLEPHALYAQPQLALERVHPDERESFRHCFHASKATLVPLHWEGRHLLPDGEMRWLRVDAQPERLPDNGVIYDGIIVDVTAQRRTETALRQSEERFRLANVHAPFPVILFTSDGEVLQVNDAWTHRTGYLAEEITHIEDWLRLAYRSEQTRDDARRIIGDLWQHIGALESKDWPVHCANGEERIWDFSCVNLGHLPDGRWLQTATAVDVTEQRQAETALRAAKEEAERANAAKSEFLSRMSHELRTPLNAILGFGQLLELSELDEQEALSTNYILKAGRHLLSLVDEVLDLARAETGELHLMPEAVSVKKLVQECVGLVVRMGKARDIRCKIQIPARIASVWADEQRLRQTLLNLLANAIKYNRDGGEVVISSRLVTTERLRIEVRDTGRGISPEGIAQLFVPFSRLDETSHGIEGTGLGLVVSRRLVEAMGGALGVDSQVGVGSMFWVELPLPKGEAARKEKPVCSDPVVTQPVLQDATVLYIEDNVSNRQVVEMILSRRHPQWRLLTAATGLTGLQLAREQRPDLILLDLQLPDIQGDTVLSKVLEEPGLGHTPVIVLSADATAHSRDRLLAHGAYQYLSKPFKLDDLLHLLETTLLQNKVQQDVYSEPPFEEVHFTCTRTRA